MSYYFRQITAAQKSYFWRVFREACFNLGLSGREAQAKYRHQTMKEACGKEHLSDLNTTTDYEAVMHRLCVDAGDFEGAAKFAVADIHRLAMLVKIECCQILQLKGASDADSCAYLDGLIERSGLADLGSGADSGNYWLDVNPGNVMKLLQILDTYRRKLVRAFINEGVVETTTFFPGHRYTVNPYNRVPVQKTYYQNLQKVVVNVR